MNNKKAKRTNNLLSGLIPATMAKCYLYSSKKPKFKRLKIK